MKNIFKLKADYKPIDDQKKVIDQLCKRLMSGVDRQVLLGVTGSGKTFSIANVIERTQRPALIVAHNKTLSAQLFQEFREYFPNNAVSYFVSYYDYYQPEAYLPATDTYIEKDAGINQLIEKLRLETITNLVSRKDVIVIASVSCIYNIGSPQNFSKFVLNIRKKQNTSQNQIIDRLVTLQYERSDFGFDPATFRVRANSIDIYPPYQDNALRLQFEADKLISICSLDPLTGDILEKSIDNTSVFATKQFISDKSANDYVFDEIKKDLKNQYKYFIKNKKNLEAQRLKQRVEYDLDMIKELGYVKGIENYSRYFDGRKAGEAPFSLIDYFNHRYSKDYLVVIDESHITFPQIKGMYQGDFSRKKTLIEYGFRLPAALDNRPLKFDEFLRKIPNFIATSATPGEWEKSVSGKNISQQLIRPTGIIDPQLEIKPIENQVNDVIDQVKKEKQKKGKVLVTTLTKKTAEDLSEYLSEQNIKVAYLHSDIKTLNRSEILEKLRSGDYDTLVGVNLLREGLDLPEVTLICILDADKEGFLRSKVSLIQTIGRAARHINGRVILYADKITDSIKNTIKETNRRRNYQIKYNKKYHIVPKSIVKPIRQKVINQSEAKQQSIIEIDADSLTPNEKKYHIRLLKKEMRIAADNLDFELAIKLRNKIRSINY